MFGKIFMIHYLLYFLRLRALANALSVGRPSSILLDSSVILGADARKRGRRAHTTLNVIMTLKNKEKNMKWHVAN